MANYSYLSDGTKRSAVGDDGVGFVYLGSLVYRISGDSLSLESCSSPGGRLVAQGPDASTFLPYYFLTDHLGSVRAVVAESHDGDRVLRTTLEHNAYYPFGSRWEDPESLLSDNRYRYNGKEEQAFVGLPYIDYGARQLLAPFHIWLTQDPLAEKYYALSPYAFCAGSPILYVDPDGKDVWEINTNGEVVHHHKDETQDAFYMVSERDGQWTRTGQELIFDYGTITKYDKLAKPVKGQNMENVNRQYTIFEVKGDDNATRLFEFMANPGNTTNVEWSHVKIDGEDSGNNIVGTNHDPSSTSIGSHVYKLKHDLREVNHNHPKGTPLPSSGDKANVEIYKKRYPNIKLNIYVPSSGYSPYDENGTLDSRIKKMPDGTYQLPDGRHVRVVKK